MYKMWTKKTKAYCKESKRFAKQLKKSLNKVKDEKKLRFHHKAYLDFIGWLDDQILESHWLLEEFWEKQV